MQLPIYADFSLMSLRHSLFQPVEELHQGHTVTLHSRMDALDFCLIAHSLEGRDRGGGRLYLIVLSEKLIQSYVGFRWVYGYMQIFHVDGKSLNISIVVQRHSCFLQMCLDFWCHLLRTDKEVGLCLADVEIADHHRVAMHISATQVQCPGYLVEGRDKEGVNPLLIQSIPDFCQFCSDILSSVCGGIDQCWGRRQGRAICPDFFHRV